MKKVTIKSLELVNFKGAKSCKVAFNDGVTTISGDNGIGKSRLMDAFCWGLWGKDTKERKDYEVMTRDQNGDIIHHLTTEVIIVLGVDGKETKLVHKFEENWVKPRGCAEATLKGRQSVYEIDDVPCSAGEYSKTVNEIIPVVTFKVLSNPMYFATQMKWQDCRSLLFSIAKLEDDETIASRDIDLAHLLERMAGKDMAKYRSEIVSKRNRTKDELDKIQPKIDQTYKLMPEAENWAELSDMISSIDNQISSIDKELSDASVKVKNVAAQKKSLMDEMADLQRKQVAMEIEAKRIEMEKNGDPKAMREVAERDLNQASNDKANVSLRISALMESIKKIDFSIEASTMKRDALRMEWKAENAKSLTDYVCPTCGQQLPQDNAGAIRKAALDRISVRGHEIADLLKSYKEQKESQEKELADLKLNFQMLCNKCNNLKVEIEKAKAAEGVVSKVETSSIPGWMDLQVKIVRLSEKINDIKVDDDSNELSEAKQPLMRSRDLYRERLAKKAEIEKYEAEIESLKAEAKEKAQLIANYQREEDLISKFTRLKVDLMEESINSLFDTVSFKLFDYTLDGNPVECCTPLVNGVPFGSANTAGQINAGLEIINALTTHYDTIVPVWIDNAEACNRLTDTQGQQIRLKVSEDKSLVIL